VRRPLSLGLHVGPTSYSYRRVRSKLSKHVKQELQGVAIDPATGLTLSSALECLLLSILLIQLGSVLHNEIELTQ